MSKREFYEQRAEALILPILNSLGLTSVDTEYVKEAGEYYLRFYIDKDGGVTIGDCETVSRAVSESLDREDFIPDSYILEVSSPGLGRAIKKEKDFVRNRNREVELKLFQPYEGKKEYMGLLKAFDPDTVTVLSEGREIVFERKKISLIREYVDFDKIQNKEDETQDEQGTF